MDKNNIICWTIWNENNAYEYFETFNFDKNLMN